MIDGITVDDGVVTINWQGVAGVRLQKASNLTKPNWSDIANTQGTSSATEVADEAEAYYRLIRN